MVTKESIAFIDSNWTTHLRNALTTGASQYADLSVSGDATPAGQTKFCIESARLISLQALDCRIEFYSKSLSYATESPLDLNVNNLLGWVNFFSPNTLAQSATRIQGAQFSQVATAYTATTFAAYAQNLKIPYEDKSTSFGGSPAGGQLHVNFVNLGAAKNAGDSGLVHLRFGVIATA